MRTLAAGQDALALSRDLAEVKLLTITTYSDRAAGTGATVYTFSDETVVYDGDTYSPLLMDVSAIIETMAHVPTTEPGSDGDTLSRRMTFELVNGDYVGDRLINVFDAGSGLLEFAEVEYSTVLISPAAKAQAGLRTIAGTGIHQVWFRGVISRGPIVDDEKVVLEAKTELRHMPWLYATGNDVSRRDRGKRLPEVYGEARMVECPLLVTGWVTTLASPVEGFTGPVNIDVTEIDATYDGEVLIDGERATYDNLANLISSLTARGLDGTLQAPHQAGAMVVEVVDEVIAGVAGHACDSVDAVYLRNMHNGQPWKLNTDHYSVDLSDTATMSGETITTVTFSSSQIRDALLEASASSVVSEQPNFAADASSVSTALIVPSSASEAAVGDGTAGRWLDDATSEPYYNRASWSVGSTLTRQFVSGDIVDGASSITAKEIVRWRFKIQAEATKAQTWTPAGWGTGTMALRAVFSNPTTDITAAAEGVSIECSRTEEDSFSSGDQTTVVHSAWYEPDTPGTLCGAFATATAAKLEFTGRSDNDVGFAPAQKLDLDPKLVDTEWGIEVEYIDAATLQERVDDVAIQAAAMGHDLMVWADVSGHTAPDTTYEVSSGGLIQHPADVLHHLIASRAGLGNGAVDYAVTFDDAVTNLGSDVEMGFDARRLGWTWEDIMLRVAWESRGNLIPTETVSGTVYKLLTPESDDTWPAVPASAATIDDFGDFSMIGRSIRELASSFSAAYGFRIDQGEGEEAFTEIETTTPTGAEAALGVVQYPRWYLLCYSDKAVTSWVRDWLDYMAQEHSRAAAVLSLRVEHWEGYPLELGDLRNILPPWSSSPTKCRLIEFSQTDRSGVRCRFAEVL